MLVGQMPGDSREGLGQSFNYVPEEQTLAQRRITQRGVRATRAGLRGQRTGRGVSGLVHRLISPLRGPPPSWTQDGCHSTGLGSAPSREGLEGRHWIPGCPGWKGGVVLGSLVTKSFPS